MTAPIDPIRRPTATGRAKHAKADAPDPSDASVDAAERLLPVPVDPPPPTQRLTAAARAEAAFAAQLLGQDGQKRGLRGGPAVLDAAKSTYSRTEWSGAADRRSPKGRGGKTEA